MGQILRKLDFRDRVQAVVIAYETGLARPGDDAATAARWYASARLFPSIDGAWPSRLGS